jgi:hypothetical protein
MLKISKNVGLTDVVTDVNPITTQHPITGSAVVVQLWLYNNDSLKTYQTITIDPTDTVATDESTWIQLAPDNAGVAGTYLAGGAALTMADISDSNVAKPFWVKVTTPSVADSQNKNDIKLTVAGKEFAV